MKNKIGRFEVLARRNWKYPGIVVITTRQIRNRMLWICLENKTDVHRLIAKYDGDKMECIVEDPRELREKAEKAIRALIKGGW